MATRRKPRSLSALGTTTGNDCTLSPLAWDVVIEERDDGGGEGKKTLLGGVGALAGEHVGDQANQSAIAAVHHNRVPNQIVFGPVFAGHAAIVRPIPIQHQSARTSLGNEIAIGGKRGVTWDRNLNPDIFVGIPSRAGQAVLRRVNRVACALAGKVREEQVDVGQFSGWVLVNAFEEIPGPQHVKRRLIEHNVVTGPVREL